MFRFIDPDDPVAVAWQIEVRAVMPVPRRIECRAREACDSADAPLRDVDVGRQNSLRVVPRVLDVVVLIRARLLTRREGAEVDVEGRTTGQRRVEEMHRKIAAQAAIGEPILRKGSLRAPRPAIDGPQRDGGHEQGEAEREPGRHDHRKVLSLGQPPERG